MNRLIVVSICTLLFPACESRKQSAPVADQIDSLIEAHHFQGVVLLAKDGKPFYHRATGFRDDRLQLPLDTTTIFELASVSKAFTGMVILQLHEQQKLRLDDSLAHYLPDLPYRGITLRHLLNHTSGLPDYQAVMDAHWDKSKVADNDDNITYLIRFAPPRLFEPGARYEYSNTGYMLLATIAERASGRDFLELCRTEIFQPLGMTQTDIRTREEKMKLGNMAWGHMYDSSKGRYVQADSFPAANYTVWLGNRKGPGRISSTSRDLLAWDQDLYSDRLVSAATLKEAFSPATLSNGTLSQYGFGWELSSDTVLGNYVHHSGDNPGYQTYLIRYIEKNMTVIVLSNHANPAFHKLISAIQNTLTTLPGQ